MIPRLTDKTVKVAVVHTVAAHYFFSSYVQ